MLISWDGKKNAANKRKHGISLEAASEVFSDSNRVELFDISHSIDEDRYIVIGKVCDVLFVVYTIRGDTYRLISARKATERERRFYYDTLCNR